MEQYTSLYKDHSYQYIQEIVNQLCNYYFYLYYSDYTKSVNKGEQGSREFAVSQGFSISPDWDKGHLKFDITITPHED